MPPEAPTAVLDALAAIEAGAPPSTLESQTLDFKADRSDTKKTLRILAEACTCFANAQGGVVILGVDDAVGGLEAFSGTSLEIDAIRRYVFEASRPHLTVAVDELHHKNSRLVILQVPVGASVHALTDGRTVKRVGRDCLPLDPGQVVLLEGERLGRDPSSATSSKSTEDLDPAAVGLARNYLQRLSDERSAIAAASDADLCKAIGVADGDGNLLLAGELLLCRGGSEVVVYQHRRTPGGPPDAVERLNPPLIVAFHRTLELVAARRQSTQLNLPDGQQLDLEDFPERAVREALANAVVHRQLEPHDPVSVEHSTDVLVVTSPGPLVSGVTVENILTTPSRPRNRALAKAFRDLGLIEELGTGVPRMYREMVRVGKEPPTIEATGDRVRVSLVGGPSNRSLARYIATMPPEERNDTDALLVLLYLCRNRVAQSSDLAPVLQRSAAESAQILQRLAGPPASIVEPTRESLRARDPNFRLRADVVAELGNAVVHKRRTADDIDRKVIAHVREYTRITNQTVRNLLEVGTPRASAILRDLVDRHILVRTSEARRGPGVDYGPGPEFPAETNEVDTDDAESTSSDSKPQVDGQESLFLDPDSTE